MKVLGIALVVLVALEHLYFLYLEMFLWTTPKGLKTFGNTAQKAEDSKVPVSYTHLTLPTNREV